MFIRTLLIAAMIYCFGHESFAGHRPAKLDRPLQELRHDLTRIASDGRRALVLIEDLRTMRHLAPLMRALGEPR